MWQWSCESVKLWTTEMGVFNVTNTQRLTDIANNGAGRTFYERPGARYSHQQPAYWQRIPLRLVATVSTASRTGTRSRRLNLLLSRHYLYNPPGQALNFIDFGPKQP